VRKLENVNQVLIFGVCLVVLVPVVGAFLFGATMFSLIFVLECLSAVTTWFSHYGLGISLAAFGVLGWLAVRARRKPEKKSTP